MKFDAFISYRRSDGSVVAHWLRNQIQDFKLPKTMRNNASAKLLAYLDIAYEKATEDFFQNTVLPALDSSRFLIVICTPDALKTRPDGSQNWLSREVEHFLNQGPNKRIITVIGKGNFDDPLPNGLHNKYTNIERIDLRECDTLSGRWKHRKRLHSEFLKIIVPLCSIPDEQIPVLRQEEEIRRQRRFFTRVGIVAALLTFLLLAGMYAFFQNKQARAAQNTADIRQLEQLAINIGARYPERKVLILLEAIRRNKNNIANEPALEQILRESLKPFYKSVAIRRQKLCATVLSHSNSLIATGTEDGDINLWDLKRDYRRPVLSARQSGKIGALAFSPDNCYLLSGCRDESYFQDFKPDGRLCIWSIHQPSAPPIVLRGDGSEAEDILFSPAGDYLAVTFASGLLKIWKFGVTGPVGVPVSPLPNQETKTTAFSANGKWFAIGNKDSSARVWKTDELFIGGKPTLLGGHADKVIATLTFSPDSRWLCTTSTDGNAPRATSRTARLWDLNAMPNVRGTKIFIRQTYHAVWETSFSSDSRWFFARAEISTLRLWHIGEDLQHITDYTLGGNAGDITSAAFSPDSRHLATGTRDGEVKLWTLPKSSSLMTGATIPISSRLFKAELMFGSSATVAPTSILFAGHTNEITGLLFTPNGKRLLSSSTDWSTLIWEIDKPYHEPIKLLGHEGQIDMLTTTADHQWLLTASMNNETNGGIGDNSIHCYRLSPSGIPDSYQTIFHIGTNIISPHLSPDQNWMIVGSGYRQSLLVNFTNRTTSTIQGDFVAYSKDSQWLVTRFNTSLGFIQLSTGKKFSLVFPADSSKYVTSMQIETFLFNASGNLAFVSNDTGDAWLLKMDVKNGPSICAALLTTADLPGCSSSNLNQHASFSEDGNWLVAVDNYVKSYDRHILKNTLYEKHDTISHGFLWKLKDNLPEGSKKILKVSKAPCSANIIKDRVIITDNKGIILIWDLPFKDEQKPKRFKPIGDGYPIDYINAYSSPDHHWLTVFSQNNAILFDLEQNKILLTLSEKPNAIAGLYTAWDKVVYSTDSKWAAFLIKRDPEEYGGKGPLREVELIQLKSPFKRIKLPTDTINLFDIIRFSADSKWLATGGNGDDANRAIYGTNIQLWDLTKNDLGNTPIILGAHDYSIADFEFSANNQYLFSRSIDRTIIKWDLSSSLISGSYVTLQSSLGLEFLSSTNLFPSFNNQYLLSVTEKGDIGSEFSTIEQWDISLPGLILEAKQKIGRNLSVDEWNKYFSGIPYQKAFLDLP